ncbi:MAG: hypothetical protein HY744_34050 [Deltaproteobacteria bacterium]|nr:hypothetical protein [Deltaproteobacteria bacterium]
MVRAAQQRRYHGCREQRRHNGDLRHRQLGVRPGVGDAGVAGRACAAPPAAAAVRRRGGPGRRAGRGARRPAPVRGGRANAGSRRVPDGGLECRGGTTKCGGKCVDTLVDPANCGGCGNACGPQERHACRMETTGVSSRTTPGHRPLKPRAEPTTA